MEREAKSFPRFAELSRSQPGIAATWPGEDTKAVALAVDVNAPMATDREKTSDAILVGPWLLFCCISFPQPGKGSRCQLPHIVGWNTD